MNDRIELDALLIGALYGELTPADEARLAAHLESHPADRTALADLTRTRAALHESRILAHQVEPPQSISALLLQEAARRAPRPQRETEGWFQRLVRSLAAHPAIAAAASFVVVVGVAGALYLRHGDQFTQSAPDLASERLPAAPAPSAPEPTSTTPASATIASAAPEGAAAGSDAYRAQLLERRSREVQDDGRAREALERRSREVQDDGRAREALERAAAQRTADRERQAEGRLAFDGAATRDQPDPAPGANKFTAAQEDSKPIAPTERKLQKKSGGIEVRTPELAPKDFDGTGAGAKDDTAKTASRTADTRGADRRASDELAQAPAPSAPEPAPPPTSRPPPSAVVLGKTAPQPAKRDVNPLPRKEPPVGASAAVAGASPSAEEKDKAGKPESQPDTRDDALFGWAKGKHDEVVVHVKSNNCRAAASAAIEIYNRVPAYYAANVATDRAVKPCLAYLNSERQREERVRAAKRANASEAPAQAPVQAAPPPAKPVKK